jgi:hypothetical protein
MSWWTCREIACDDLGRPRPSINPSAPRDAFDRGRQFIRSQALIARLIERRDENPIATDYDIDTDDEEMLENLNREEACPGDAQEVLSADELEKALHALEVESFAVMMRHVQVSFAKPAVFPCYYSSCPERNTRHNTCAVNHTYTRTNSSAMACCSL